MPRYRLTIEYDGTPFAGWQRQEGRMSVQQALEEALAGFAQHPVVVTAAGRTDSGVHALGQVVHADLEDEWDEDKVAEAANGILRHHGHPVAVLSAERAAADFDARFSAIRRHYLYRIVCRRAPLTVDAGRAWHVRKPLDAGAMHEAAQILVGHHDFTTFRDTQCQAKNPVRTLDSLEVTAIGDFAGAGRIVTFKTSSRAFLHSQVRSMVGSLKLVGEGKWTPSDLKAALEARDRKACGPVAPACGLYFAKVDY